MNLPETSIIGAGGLGTVLAKTFFERNIPVKSVFNRTEKKARELGKSIEIKLLGAFPTVLDELGELIFITVSDDTIEEVSRRLSKLDGDFNACTFVHCSGIQSADSLQPLKSKGATVASFHPLQTFTSHTQPDDFKDIYFSMQGDEEAFPLLKKVAKQLGAEIFEVTKEQKSHLHTAATMVSNYLTTLLDASVKAGSHGGLTNEQVKKGLLPLIRTTLKNNEIHSSAEALTGPIKRGDTDTIEKHLTLLDDKPELRDLYCVLGLHTVQLADSLGHLDEPVIEKMRKILS